MSLLLYGPPGTGKSEFARAMARRLGREIMIRRASDLLSPYVSMTEKMVARAFHEAEETEAILVIEEVDTFLYPRQSAERSREISATNEFLTWLETHRGLVIGTTNRAVNLDHAAWRRFNLKVRLDWLTAEGKLVFFKRFLTPLLKKPIFDDEQRALAAAPRPAPGDFKVVRDRFYLLSTGQTTASRLLESLARESEWKKDESRRLGF
jgi:SpoVK/Ycf46/Vps4 family AAA+-type ATPase